MNESNLKYSFEGDIGGNDLRRFWIQLDSAPQLASMHLSSDYDIDNINRLKYARRNSLPYP